MKRSLLILFCLAVVLAGGSLVWQRRAAHNQQLALEKAKAERAAELDRLRNQERRTLAPIIVSPQEPAARSTGVTSAAKPEPTAQATETNVPDPSTTPGEQLLLKPNKGKVWENPLARIALSFVGDDAVAEAIWIDAINDPNLPPKERRDLIEDLNEDGFPDPKNLTVNDLPLILSRLALIEEYLPLAMDDVNADAFMEAYKDLVNMAAKVMQQ